MLERDIPMSSIENDFFEELLEWSNRKLEIITKYLDGFVRILGSGSRRSALYFVDGFAGKGIYSNGEKGSPVRAAEYADNAIKQHGRNMRCVFVEKDPNNYSDLQKSIFLYSRIVVSYQGTFSDKVDKILVDVGKNAALFFIDDFGVKGTDWNTVKKVLSRTEITDVWIRFDHKTIRRLDGFFYSDGKGATEKTALLCELFGISDPELLHKLLDAPSPEDRIKKAVNLYRDRLKEVLGKDGFVGFYPIISLDGQNKYHLLFACKNPKAAVLASDVVNTVEDNLPIKQSEHLEKQRLEKTGQLSLFNAKPSPSELFTQRVDEVKDYVLAALQDGEISVDELRYKLICQNPDLFGRFRQKHLTRSLNELSKTSKITLDEAPSKGKTKITKIF